MRMLLILLLSCLTGLSQGLPLPLVSSKRVATASFSPSDISGLTAWFEADFQTGFSTGDGVPIWTNQVSGGSNFISSGLANAYFQTNVINGRSAIALTNITPHENEMWLAYPNGAATDYEVMIVMKTWAWGNYTTVIFGTNGWGAISCHADNTGQLYYGTANDGSRIETGASYVANDTGYLIDMWKSGSSSGNLHIQKNGGSAQANTGLTAPSPSAADLVIGRDLATGTIADAWFAAIFIFNKALNSTERGQMETYVDGRYNVIP